MVRALLGVIGGYLVWTVIWLGGNALLFRGITDSVNGGQPYAAPFSLMGVIALSVLCSLAGGAACVAVARNQARPAVLITAVLLLITAVAVEIGYWSLVPAWFILTFWLLIVPVTFLGGRLIGRAA